MKPRERRLLADYEKIKADFTSHPIISYVLENDGTKLPEKYIINYNGIRGIRLSSDSTPQDRKVEYTNKHTMQIYLNIDYPRLKPQCFMKTPVFHPNIRYAMPNDVCIGDYWAPGETLSDIIYLVGEMIMYQNYNIKSPLNGIAAKWARENLDKFPLDDKTIRLPEINIEFKN